MVRPFPHLGGVENFSQGPCIEAIRPGGEGRRAPGQPQGARTHEHVNNNKLSHHLPRAYCVPGLLHRSPLIP